MICGYSLNWQNTLHFKMVSLGRKRVWGDKKKKKLTLDYVKMGYDHKR